MRKGKAVSTLRVPAEDNTKLKALRQTADTWGGIAVARKKNNAPTEGVKVQVTRLMVDYALQQTSTMCGVALGLREANENWILPKVTQKEIRVTDRQTGERLVWDTPPRVASWIDKFDRQKETVGPIAFVLGEPKAARPIRHRQPSEIIAQTERDKARKKVVNARRTTMPPGFTNTRMRQLREVPEDS